MFVFTAICILIALSIPLGFIAYKLIDNEKDSFLAFYFEVVLPTIVSVIIALAIIIGITACIANVCMYIIENTSISFEYMVIFLLVFNYFGVRREPQD